MNGVVPQLGQPTATAPAGTLRVGLCAYLELQSLGIVALIVAIGLYEILRRMSGLPIAWFEANWLAAFVLVPASFVPALKLWHGRMLRRFGPRAATYRLVAELAFAAEVVAFVMVRGIA